MGDASPYINLGLLDLPALLDIMLMEEACVVVRDVLCRATVLSVTAHLPAPATYIVSSAFHVWTALI